VGVPPVLQLDLGSRAFVSSRMCLREPASLVADAFAYSGVHPIWEFPGEKSFHPVERTRRGFKEGPHPSPQIRNSGLRGELLPVDLRRRFDTVSRISYAFSAASFSCIADGMNRKYPFSIIATLVPVCAATVSGSSP
jgi:hypothetical protein